MLAAMESSRFDSLRQMLSLLKTCVGFCYGADPSVRAAIGYPVSLGEPRSEREAAP